MMLFTIFIVAAVLLFYIFISFPGGKSSTPKLIEIHFADNITQAHLAVINRFNKEYEGKIKVVPINLPFDKFSTNERKRLLARSLRSKISQIDVFTVDQIWVKRFARWAEPLGKYFTRKELDRILPAALKTCYDGDSLVAIPLNIDIGTMYYRSDLLRKYSGYEEIEAKLRQGISWNDFIALGKKLNHPGPFYLFQAQNFEGLVCSFMEVVLGSGADLNFFGAINLNTPEIRNALQLLVDLVHTYRLTPVEVSSMVEFDTYKYFIQHDGLFLRGWPHFVQDYLTSFRDSTKSPEFTRVPLPHFNGEKGCAIFGGWNIMVSRFSDKKNAAITFVKYLHSEEIQKFFFEQAGFLPLQKDMYKPGVLADPEGILPFYEKQFERGLYRPSHESYTRISDVLAFYVHLAVKGELSAEEALTKATELLNDKEIFLR